MKRIVQRLRLRQGDILVVRNIEDGRRVLHCGARVPRGVTSIPVVVAPDGIQRVPLDTLKRLVAKLEKEIKNGKD